MRCRRSVILHENSSQDFTLSTELSVYITPGFCDGSRNFIELFPVSCEVFVFTRIQLNPLGGKDLEPRQRIDCFVSHFLFENFVTMTMTMTHPNEVSTWYHPCPTDSNGEVVTSAKKSLLN